MIYLVDNLQYSFSYQDLKERYENYIFLSDEDFLNQLTDILHFTCFVAYIKELPNECTISDLGILHELIHLKLCLEKNFMIENKEQLIRKVREQFRLLIKLD